MVSNAICFRGSCYIDPVLIRFISTYEINIHSSQSCDVDHHPSHGVLDTVLCDSLSVTCGGSVVFTRYSDFHHEYN